MFLLSIIVILGFGFSCADPCNEAPVLHDLHRRYVSYTVDSTNNEPYVCDAFVIPLEGGWYKTNGIEMPTTHPFLSGCGTQYPIWLNGQLPTQVGTVNDMQACTVGLLDTCDTARTIKVLRCADLSYRYFLLPTTSCEEAYCFGGGTQDTPPTFNPGTPVVHWEFVYQEVITAPNAYVERYWFECRFSTDLSNDLFYQVIWYFDENPIKSELVKRDSLDDSVLRENDFPSIGVSIKCSVRPKHIADGSPGVFGISASSFFGIQLDNTVVSFPKSGIGIIKVRLTIPFGCFYINAVRQPCTLSIGMVRKDSNEDNCKESGDIVGEERFCVRTIEIDNWDKIHELTIKWKDGDDYRLTETDFLLDLQTSRTAKSDVWNFHTKIPTIQVKVHEDTYNVKSKRCYIENDPHMRTFDGRYFEHHISGVFTLYKDITNPTYEVQHQTAVCNGPYHCTCGVAVRSGADVFVVDYCNGQTISFITCHEKKLDVRKESARKYLVFLPSGTSIEIHISWNRWLTAYINPSIHDWKNSRGLCGYASDRCDDDFVKPDGTNAGDVGSNHACNSPRFTPKLFIESWQILKMEDNLFALQDNAAIPPSSTTEAYCTCPHNRIPDADSTDFECGSSATISCEIELEYDPVGKEQCNAFLGVRRRKRSLEFPVKSVEKKFRVKRQPYPSNTVNMTPNEVKTFCTELLQSSPVFNECADIPEVDADEYIAICALDIELTNTLLFSNQTVEDFKSTCIKELRMNNTLKEQGPDGQPSIASILRGKICAGNPPCSGNGNCVNGTCICFGGYISPDCSIDLTLPPELIGVRGEGLCDKNEVPCNMSFVIAEEIYETADLSCEVVEYQISVSGTYTRIHKQKTTAKHETLVEVLCPITTFKEQSTYVSRSDMENFATGYTVSVSYDGVLFSDPVEMLVYDSLCQDIVNTTDKTYFALKDGFCKIDDRCVSTGEYSLFDPCLRCDTTTSLFSWTTDEEKYGCAKVPPDEKNISGGTVSILTIALATCIPVAFIVVAVIIVLRIKFFKAKASKVSGSQEFGTIKGSGLNTPPQEQ